MKSEIEVKPCPCGETPNKLHLIDNGIKWCWVTGDCCGEWHIEIRTNYKELDSPELMKEAIDSWNLTKRHNEMTPEKAREILGNHFETLDIGWDCLVHLNGVYSAAGLEALACLLREAEQKRND